MTRERLLRISRLLSEADALAHGDKRSQGIRDGIAAAQRAVAAQLDQAEQERP